MNLTAEQLADDDTGKAVVNACFREIHIGHVLAYTTLVFKPTDMNEKQRTEAMQAVFQFAALGWSAFHLMNRGRDIPPEPKTGRKSRKKKPKKQA